MSMKWTPAVYSNDGSYPYWQASYVDDQGNSRGSVTWWESDGPWYPIVAAGRAGAYDSLEASKAWVEKNWNADEIVHPHEIN